ncbi:ribonuclease HI [Stigmatella aurantiaca]|uniref:Ribonuclease H n=1 Tax=Stigmatella aurantiaca (strain DW4/3-1) TaxID=378806 RepID=Q08YU2_STIAD|nr:ribonuclease HI [Stigmatella aurantiaca]ADO68509.1 Ribonuclease H [Stigmatella aurantiaca DW4/3-1]EAU65652.1 RNase H [Stigmatella aurantiaca DW4/3-1]
MTLPLVHIYCDGACSPNPGIGGWGSILVSPAHGHARKELSGAEPGTTNNRMELTAALMALRALKSPCQVQLFTDSQYVRNAFQEKWLDKWQRTGWKTAGRQPVQNADLWQALLEQTRVHQVSWNWVRGHSGHVENERADAMAVAARLALAAKLGR